MNRRGALVTTGVTLSTVLCGCLTDSSNDSVRSSSTSVGTTDPPISVQTPSKGECRVSIRLRPTPDSSRTKRYPTIPKPLTASTAKSFATSFERAYQYNSRLPEYDNIEIDLTVPEWAISRSRGGYIIALTGRVQFDNTETSTTASTPRPSGFFKLSVWYYLTDRFVLRGPPTDTDIQQGDKPKLTDADTVACDTTDK